MDYTNRFVVYNKIEIVRLENRVEELVRENERLKEMGEKCRELEFENLKLKNQLNHRRAMDEDSLSINTINMSNGKGSDQSTTINFIQGQETRTEDILKVNLTPTHSPVTDCHQNNQTNGYLNHGISTDITDSSNDSSNIGYGNGYLRRKSNFNVPKEKSDHIVDNSAVNQSQKEHRILENNNWSFPNLNNTNSLLDLTKQMRNKCDKNIMFKIIAKQWNKKPETMSRMEFFYHLLTIFIENGILITTCAEHNPPCRPRVDTKIFEKNADVLKSFIGSVNRYKLIVIEVEMLAALENVAYIQPKYRPAVSEIMDILFRKGVVEAVAFGEWSQMDSSRPEDKIRLIREIKASGFSLLKRSSSL